MEECMESEGVCIVQPGMYFLLTMMMSVKLY